MKRSHVGIVVRGCVRDKKERHVLSAIADIMATFTSISHAATTDDSAYYDGVANHNARVHTYGTTVQGR